MCNTDSLAIILWITFKVNYVQQIKLCCSLDVLKDELLYPDNLKGCLQRPLITCIQKYVLICNV